MKLFALLGLASAEKIFNPKPTGGERPCDYYTFVAEANFSDGFGPAEGKVTLTQSACKDGITFEGNISFADDEAGIKKRGWHIHEFGRTVQGCGPDQTGGHFNPYTAPGSAYTDARRNREVGQIGNLECDGGNCPVSFTDKITKLHGMANLIGRSIVIHENPEDEVVGGGSGGRLACATIVWAGQSVNGE